MNTPPESSPLLAACGLKGANPSGPFPSGPLSEGRRSRAAVYGMWLCRLGLIILPLALALGFYYRPAWRQGIRSLPIGGDAPFYVYQLQRVGELGGRWWQLSTDPGLGQPYPTIAAKHPGLYEGVDLMLVSSLTSRFLSAPLNYHAMVLLVLAINGWVAGWLVQRLTRSYFWAAVAVVVITLNLSTASRLSGHLNLFKHGWVLLAIWAFSRYLAVPSLKRGVVLGIFLALVLASSFYFGFFVTVALGAYGLGCLAWRRLLWKHGPGALAAGLTYAALGAALTFPVWSKTLNTPLSESYFHRYQAETSFFSSEPWQYVVSPYWKYAKAGGPESMPLGEGWHFPGCLVLVGVAAYVFARWRGGRLTLLPAAGGEANSSDWKLGFLDILMGLSGILVLLSLKGGPMLMIYSWVRCFRCYGRAGLVAVGIWSVAASVTLCVLIGKVQGAWLRLPMCAGVLALALYDGYQGQRFFAYAADLRPPAWVSWLAQQPANVRLAAFSAWNGRPGTVPRHWEWDSLYYRLLHGHETLNGCEFGLLNADLRLLGASYEHLNPAGLRFIVSLGYSTLAFERDYLAANPWIARTAWLKRLQAGGGWEIYAATAALPRYPHMPMHELLMQAKEAESPTQVPSASWITGQLEVHRTVVVGADAQARLTWMDASGQRVSRPVLALFQHVFGPALPAYTIQTPSRAGHYRLVFLDALEQPISSQPFDVVAGLTTSRQIWGDRVPVPHVRLEPAAGGPMLCRAVVENRSALYLQALGNRPQLERSIRLHPGMFDGWAPWASALSVVLWYHPLRNDEPAQEMRFLLPHDLPPFGKLVMDLPIESAPGTNAGSAVSIAWGLGHGSVGLLDAERAALLDARMDSTGDPVFAP